MNLSAYSIMFSTKFLPLMYALIGFGLLITVHEFGHFLFCKMFGIGTPTFSIGFGPKIIEKQIGDTKFRLAALPFGGYVEIAGLAEVGQGAQEDARLRDGTSFNSKPYWQKVFVLLGGVLFNLLFAYVAFSILFFVGIPKKKGNVIISSRVESTVTEKYNLQPGDKIVSINNITLNEEPKKLLVEIHDNFIKPLTSDPNTQIPIVILRNEEMIKVNIQPKADAAADTLNWTETLINSLEFKSTPIEGEYEKYPLISAISHGIQVTNQWIFQIIFGIKYLITQRTLKGAGGPIMIVSKTFETAQKGIIPLIIFLAIISINLAIINILPLGALDGGQLLFATIEAIIRREVPEIVRLVINLSSWVLLLGLILYLSYKDILALFTGKM